MTKRTMVELALMSSNNLLSQPLLQAFDHSLNQETHPPRIQEDHTYPLLSSTNFHEFSKEKLSIKELMLTIEEN